MLESDISPGCCEDFQVVLQSLALVQGVGLSENRDGSCMGLPGCMSTDKTD